MSIQFLNAQEAVLIPQSKYKSENKLYDVFSNLDMVYLKLDSLKKKVSKNW